ncbi:MAG: hypothetical protein AAB883_02110 [Patescibacteria group bacterium]
MHTFFDGTISYNVLPGGCPKRDYELSTRLSDGAPSPSIFDLDRLQAKSRNTLDMEHDGRGNLTIRQRVVAHGPESACKQAWMLQMQLYAYTGLKVNIARGICPA